MMSFARVISILVPGACVVLAGCEGDNPNIRRDPPPGDTTTGETTGQEAGGVKSGTRLRARYTMGADGSREFVGWHDTERHEDCSFRQGDSEKLRCIPTAHPVLDYSDADCTMPVVTLPPQLDCDGNPPKYVLAMDYTEACAPEARLFEMGAAIQTTIDPVYRSTAQGCQQLGAGAMPVFYEVGAEIPMTELVEGRIVME